MSDIDTWSKLEEEILKCTRCRLYLSRKNPVPGEGDRQASIFLVGEAPGEKEDESGRPFIGPAGKLLTELIESIGLRREKVYITNIVKCRPPGNRDPERDEIEACLPYLIRQIKLIKPKIIIALGRHAARALFELTGLKWINMTRQHGKTYSTRLLGLEVKIIPTYHPASALYNPSLRRIIEEDFRKVIKSTIEETLVKPGKAKTHVTLLDFIDEKYTG